MPLRLRRKAEFQSSFSAARRSPAGEDREGCSRCSGVRTPLRPHISGVPKPILRRNQAGEDGERCSRCKTPPKRAPFAPSPPTEAGFQSPFSAGSRPGMMGTGVPGGRVPPPALTPLVRLSSSGNAFGQPEKWLLDLRLLLSLRSPEKEEAPPRGLGEELPEDRAPRRTEDSAGCSKPEGRPEKMHWERVSRGLLPRFPRPSFNSDFAKSPTRGPAKRAERVHTCKTCIIPGCKAAAAIGMGGARMGGA